MSTATLVSFMPFELAEEKIGIFPPTYYLPPSDTKKPTLLVVHDAMYYMETWVGENKNMFPVPMNAQDLCRSIVSDYRNSLVEVDESAYPALFFVPEEVDADTLLKKYGKEVLAAVTTQNNWFRRLIEKADDLWEKHRQHRVIPDDARAAARVLGLDRPWIVSVRQTSKCPACETPVSPTQIICSTCRCILNKDAYDKQKFAMAG